ADSIIEFNRTTYLDALKTHDTVLLEFYANWCEACHYLSSEFNRFAETAQKEHPEVLIARVDISEVEYLASSYLIDTLPEIAFLRRPQPGATHEVRFVSAEFSEPALVEYIEGGWVKDKPVGGYKTVWCTPVNLCGHLGGKIGESVVYLDANFNTFNMPPWAFMGIVVTLLYAVGQILVMFLGRLTRRKHRERIYKKYDKAPGIVGFDEYRSDLPKRDADAAPKKSTKAHKDSKPKKAKKD
ncbi:hypothetical protein EC988_001963, partial [Linderina pennispora]